ncbi:MAG: serine/threonine protein kinase [Spirochaetota bacterium]
MSEPREPGSLSRGAFGALSPDLVVSAVESFFGLALDGTLQPYPSYVNRVYGVRTDDGAEYVVKFYRPGRWSVDAIAEEHEFVLDCADAELPVVAPIADADGFTLQIVEVDAEASGEPAAYPFALYEKRGGRGFDAERDEDWFRLGSLAGRVHSVGRRASAHERLVCTPSASTRGFVEELRVAGVVHPELSQEFFALAEQGIELIEPLFGDVPLQRIHGDFHRGNVLERGDEGLLLIDFDDMMIGPPVQDLWLLLPDHAWAARRELAHIVDGYTQFCPFDHESLRLVEPLRFMRMLYYLAWSALQAGDHRFRVDHPDWGGRSFWIREIEDLRTQLSMVVEDLSD